MVGWWIGIGGARRAIVKGPDFSRSWWSDYVHMAEYPCNPKILSSSKVFDQWMQMHTLILGPFIRDTLRFFFLVTTHASLVITSIYGAGGWLAISSVEMPVCSSIGFSFFPSAFSAPAGPAPG